MIAAKSRRTTETDTELMGRIVKGDARAFEAIYDRHHRQAYGLARRIMGPADGAEEATQDAFISLWRGAASFDPERASLRTWLFTLVRHRSIDSLRRGGTRRAFDHGVSQDVVERIEAPERTEEQVLAIQEHDRARRYVAELPPEQREVIGLAYFAGYSQSEIAAKIGIPLGTVKGRARLGLHKLRSRGRARVGPRAHRVTPRIPVEGHNQPLRNPALESRDASAREGGLAHPHMALGLPCRNAGIGLAHVRQRRWKRADRRGRAGDVGMPAWGAHPYCSGMGGSAETPLPAASRSQLSGRMRHQAERFLKVVGGRPTRS